MITKPIGEKLLNYELPGGSFVNAEIVEAPDGLPSIQLSSLFGKEKLEVSAHDLLVIHRWATT